MRSVIIALLGVASVEAIVMTKEVREAFHTDEWCAKHHLGEGPSTCIQNPGCCYDGSLGICHSCDFHSHEWCTTYGGDTAQTCVKFAGCTFQFAENASEEDMMNGQCVSSKTPEEANIRDEISCTVAAEESVCNDESGEPETRLWYDGNAEHPERPKLQCSDKGLSEVKYPALGSMVEPFMCSDNATGECPSDGHDGPEVNCECKRPMTAEMQIECDGGDCINTGKYKYRVAPYGYYMPECTTAGEYEVVQATMMIPFICRIDPDFVVPDGELPPNCADVQDAEGCDSTKQRCQGCQGTAGCIWAERDAGEGDQALMIPEMKWCADKHGHEIPDTRKKGPQFDAERINCTKKRRQYEGEQCPNAVTLTTGNGEVFINDHEDVGNCDMLCNTDMDCFPGNEDRPTEWCCFNGCGYSCQIPIKPKADCEHLGAGELGPGIEASDLMEEDLGGDGSGGHAKHGSEVTLSCMNGWNAEKDANGKRVNSITVSCAHGKWGDFSSLKCMEDCPPYRVRGGQHRMNSEVASEDRGMCIGGADPSYEWSERTGSTDVTKPIAADWHRICGTALNETQCLGRMVSELDGISTPNDNGDGVSAECRWVPSNDVNTYEETSAATKIVNGSYGPVGDASHPQRGDNVGLNGEQSQNGYAADLAAAIGGGAACRPKEMNGDTENEAQMAAYAGCMKVHDESEGAEAPTHHATCAGYTNRKDCNWAGSVCNDGNPADDPRTALCEWVADSLGEMVEHTSPFRIAKGRNKAMRTRDYVVKGNGNEHGSKRRVSCAEGFGAVAGTLDMIAYNRQKVRCVNGAWEPQELVCSTCFDAPSSGKFAWRDDRGNDCLYYSSRPMECTREYEKEGNPMCLDENGQQTRIQEEVDGQMVDVLDEHGNPDYHECYDAKDACRVACRTCPDAQAKYRVKAIMKTIDGVEHPESWTRKYMKILVGHQREIKSQRRVKVAKRVKKA